MYHLIHIEVSYFSYIKKSHTTLKTYKKYERVDLLETRSTHYDIGHVSV